MNVSLDQVAALIERWRDARGMSKARVASDAAALLKGMSPDQQRGLALEVVNRVAPQLAGQVAAESGALSGGQVKALLNMLNQASPQDLTGLVTALRTGEVGPALAMASQVVEVLDPDMHTQAVEALDGIDGDLDGQVGWAGVSGAATAAREASDADRNARRATMRAEAKAASEARQDRWRGSATTSEPVVTVDVPSMTFDFAPAAPQGATGTRRRDATDGTPTAAGAAAAAATGVPVASDGWDVTADGWRRRRAVMAAIREGDRTRADILDGVASLGRASDRLWVCKTLVAVYGVDPEGLVDLIDSDDVASLRRLGGEPVPA